MDNREQLGSGFYKGSNHVRKKFMSGMVGEKIEWKPFLFYIGMMFTITKYDEDSFELVIITKKQLEIFFKKVKNYKDSVEVINYKTNQTNRELWQENKNSQTEDKVIISILSKDKWMKN